MLHTIEVVKKLLTTESEQFEYIEVSYSWGSFGKNYDRYFDWMNDYNYGKTRLYDYLDSLDDEDEEDPILLYVYFYNEKFQEDCDCVSGKTEDEAWGRFFKKYPDICYNLVLDYEIDYA